MPGLFNELIGADKAVNKIGVQQNDKETAFRSVHFVDQEIGKRHEQGAASYDEYHNKTKPKRNELRGFHFKKKATTQRLWLKSGG